MSIIFNIQEAVKLSAFNIAQEPVKFLLENEKEAFEKESLLSKIFVMKTTDRYQEEYRTSTKLGGFEPTADLERPNLTDFEEGYGKIFRNQIWTNSFVISKQAIEDNQNLDINHKALGFIRSYGRSRELFGFAILAGGLVGEIKVGKYTFDCKGMDTVDGAIDSAKQLYFHNDHKSVLPDVPSQSNKFYHSIDLTAAGAYEQLAKVVGIVETKMMNYTDYNGEPVVVAPDTIIVPNHYNIREALLVALRTPQTSAMGNNGINIQYGKWNILTSVYLNKHPGFSEADQAFIMLDSKTNKENLGAVWFDRKGLEVTSYVDNGTKANYWDGRARFGAGFGDFRAMAYVATGTSPSNIAKKDALTGGNTNTTTI